MEQKFGKKPSKILLVEDDADIQEAMADILSEEGFLVELASNGQEALDMLTQQHFVPDVILLDLMMPIMDGWAFRQIQKADPVLAVVPVVVVSADRNAEDQAKDMEAAAFLPKPVNLFELLDTLEDLPLTSEAPGLAVG